MKGVVLTVWRRKKGQNSEQIILTQLPSELLQLCARDFSENWEQNNKQDRKNDSFYRANTLLRGMVGGRQ